MILKKLDKIHLTSRVSIFLQFSLGLSLYALLLEFHWDTLALIYAPDKANKCETIIEEVTVWLPFFALIMSKIKRFFCFTVSYYNRNLW